MHNTNHAAPRTTLQVFAWIALVPLLQVLSDVLHADAAASRRARSAANSVMRQSAKQDRNGVCFSRTSVATAPSICSGTLSARFTSSGSLHAASTWCVSKYVPRVHPDTLHKSLAAHAPRDLVPRAHISWHVHWLTIPDTCIGSPGSIDKSRCAVNAKYFCLHDATLAVHVLQSASYGPLQACEREHKAVACECATVLILNAAH